MLVNRIKMTSRRGSKDDSGSTLVVVLIVMLVLAVGGTALAGIIVNTTGTLAGSRSRAQAQAAVDAGIAAQTARLESGELPCAAKSENGILVADATGPRYDYSLQCGAGSATLTVKSSVAGASAGRQTVFAYDVAPTSGEGGDIVIFAGDLTVTNQVNIGTAGKPVDIMLPNGSFICQNTIYGSIVAKNDVKTNGSCTINGDLTSAAGRFSMSNDSDTVNGNVTAGGPDAGGAPSVQGRVTGKLHTNHSLGFGWGGKTFGNVIVNGSVSLGNAKLSTLTIPNSAALNSQSGSVGTVSKVAAVPAPAVPDLSPWFEYKYAPADWSGYTVTTLTASGAASTPGTCAYFNSSPSTGWTTYLNSITGNTIIDARACPRLSANAGAQPVVSLKHNLVLLANSFDVTDLTFQAAAGAPTGANKPGLWLITEDTKASDKKPTCLGSQAATVLNHFVAKVAIKTMVYSPCGIGFAGNNSEYSGVLYGGGWTGHGAGINYTADSIGLPGMGGSGSGSGGAGAKLSNLAVVSNRDVQ